MFSKVMLVAVAALAFASNAVAKPAHRARPVTPAEQKQVDDVAAQVQTWAAQMVLWSKPDNDLLLAMERELVEVTSGAARATHFIKHADRTADLTWATEWIAARKATYAELQTRAAQPTQPTPSIPARLATYGKVGRMKSALLKQHGMVTAAITRYAPIHDELLQLVDSAARGDSRAPDQLRRRLVEMNIALLENENATFETGIATSDDNSASTALMKAEQEGNLALIDAYRFILDQKFGSGADLGATAASIRAHAQNIDAAADQMGKAAHKSADKIGFEPAVRKTPLYGIAVAVAENYDESAQVEHGLADIDRGLADAIEHSKGDPFEVLGAVKGSTVLVERRLALGVKRRSLVTG